MRLILASGSASRRAMLDAAGVPFEAISPDVDEDSAKESLRASGCLTRDLADALAELKALKLSGRQSDALVLGSDSIVELQDGRLLDKPADRDQAAEHLRLLSGRRHYLYSAAGQQIFIDFAHRSFHSQVKDRPGRLPLWQIKTMKADPAAVEAQSEEIKAHYAKIFGV